MELSDWRYRMNILDATKDRLLSNYDKVWEFYIEAFGRYVLEQRIVSLLSMKICICAKSPKTEEDNTYVNKVLTEALKDLQKAKVCLQEAREKFDNSAKLLHDFITQLNNLSKNRDKLSDIFEALTCTMELQSKKKLCSVNKQANSRKTKKK